MNIRQIITGNDDEGNAIFLADQNVNPIEGSLVPGYQSFELWSTKVNRTVPHKGELAKVDNYFPNINDSVFRVITLPPQIDGKTPFNFSPEAIAETKAILPGLIEHLDLTSPGMHTTDSIDYGIVLKGEIYLELDNGAERLLTAGDCIVQNGTRHSWVNKSSEPTIMAFVLLGAKRES